MNILRRNVQTCQAERIENTPVHEGCAAGQDTYEYNPPLTHREHCSSFTVITGHEDPEKNETALDWARIAQEPGTKVVLMGVERIGKIAYALIENGLSKDTPVAMVRWGTTGRQKTISGTLGTIADIVIETKFKAPAVTIIGDVSNLRKSLNWFEKRPLCW